MTTGQANRATRLDMVALTISPPDLKLSLQDTWLYHLKRIASVDSKIWLIPETDSKGRLHYHGLLWKDKHYKESLEKFEKMGFIKVKPIRDYNGWIKYCKKEFKITKSMLELNNRFKCIDNEYVSKYKISNTSRNILSYFENCNNDHK